MNLSPRALASVVVQARELLKTIWEVLLFRDYCSGHGETRAARFGPALYRTPGNKSSFKPFPAFHFTANCPKEGCATEGLDFHGEELERPLSLGLIVGDSVRNEGLPTGKLVPMKGKVAMPEVLQSLPV